MQPDDKRGAPQSQPLPLGQQRVVPCRTKGLVRTRGVEAALHRRAMRQPVLREEQNGHRGVLQSGRPGPL